MSPRKKGFGTNISGRPPKDPMKKVGTPVRALVTKPMANLLNEAARQHGIPDPTVRGIVASDILRLYMYHGLIKDGLMTPEVAEDPSWDSLRGAGLV